MISTRAKHAAEVRVRRRNADQPARSLQIRPLLIGSAPPFWAGGDGRLVWRIRVVARELA
jgi:hypothetical protein